MEHLMLSMFVAPSCRREHWQMWRDVGLENSRGWGLSLPLQCPSPSPQRTQPTGKIPHPLHSKWTRLTKTDWAGSRGLSQIWHCSRELLSSSALGSAAPAERQDQNLWAGISAAAQLNKESSCSQLWAAWRLGLQYQLWEKHRHSVCHSWGKKEVHLVQRNSHCLFIPQLVTCSVFWGAAKNNSRFSCFRHYLN